MIRILAVHNSNLTKSAYEKQLKEKYKFLNIRGINGEAKLYSITVIKIGKYPKRKFDKIYFDSDTVSPEEAYSYQAKYKGYVIWASLKKGVKNKFQTRMIAQIKKLEEK